MKKSEHVYIINQKWSAPVLEVITILNNAAALNEDRNQDEIIKAVQWLVWRVTEGWRPESQPAYKANFDSHVRNMAFEVLKRWQIQIGYAMPSDMRSVCVFTNKNGPIAASTSDNFVNMNNMLKASAIINKNHEVDSIHTFEVNAMPFLAQCKTIDLIKKIITSCNQGDGIDPSDLMSSLIGSGLSTEVAMNAVTALLEHGDIVMNKSLKFLWVAPDIGHSPAVPTLPNENPRFYSDKH